MDLDAKNFMLLLRLELPEAVADDAEKHLSALLRRVRAATLRDAAAVCKGYASQQERARDSVYAERPNTDRAFLAQMTCWAEGAQDCAAAIHALDADKEGGEGG